MATHTELTLQSHFLFSKKPAAGGSALGRCVLLQPPAAPLKNTHCSSRILVAAVGRAWFSVRLMGGSASVVCRDAPPSTCRICLSLSSLPRDEEVEYAGGSHRWPPSEAQRSEHDGYLVSDACILMENHMLSPCDCSGTQQHVHLHCLLRWIALQPSRGTKCEICNSSYRGVFACVLADPVIQSFFRMHRTLFACCTTNSRYDRRHFASLSVQMKDKLVGCIRAGGFILQTRTRAAMGMEQEVKKKNLLADLLASRRAHWHKSAFLILFSRPRAASDGSAALIAVNVTQQLRLSACESAVELQQRTGVRCSVFKGGPCASNRPIAILSVEAAVDCRMLFEMAKAVYHPSLVHAWRCAATPCCFYR